MKQFITKIKPSIGLSQIFYNILNILLPFVVYVLVTWDLALAALVVILLSKWRMLAVRPHFWPANIRANSVDIIVNVALLLFMMQTVDTTLRLIWVGLYLLWLVFIKPATGVFMVSLQAFVGMLSGLMALFTVWGDAPLLGLVLATGFMCYLAARHFFDSFEEPYARLLALLWAYFAAALVWVLGHWLVYYYIVAQPVLLLMAIGSGLSTLYYLDHHEKLSGGIQKQIIFIMVATIIIVMIFPGWRDKII